MTERHDASDPLVWEMFTAFHALPTTEDVAMSQLRNMARPRTRFEMLHDAAQDLTETPAYVLAMAKAIDREAAHHTDPIDTFGVLLQGAAELQVATQAGHQGNYLISLDLVPDPFVAWLGGYSVRYAHGDPRIFMDIYKTSAGNRRNADPTQKAVKRLKGAATAHVPVANVERIIQYARS